MSLVPIKRKQDPFRRDQRRLQCQSMFLQLPSQVEIEPFDFETFTAALVQDVSNEAFLEDVQVEITADENDKEKTQEFSLDLETCIDDKLAHLDKTELIELLLNSNVDSLYKNFISTFMSTWHYYFKDSELSEILLDRLKSLTRGSTAEKTDLIHR